MRKNKLPKVLNKQEAEKLLKQPNRKCTTGLRNYTLMSVMLKAGLRVNEALNLKARDIDKTNCLIRVNEGKGDKDRVVNVDPSLIDTLQTWIARKPPGPLFATLKGKQLNDRYVRQMVKREARQAGIDLDVHPHTLRHTFATLLLEQGLTIREVQEQMGHSDLATTSIYLHVLPLHLAEKMAKFGQSWAV